MRRQRQILTPGRKREIAAEAERKFEETRQQLLNFIADSKWTYGPVPMPERANMIKYLRANGYDIDMIVTHKSYPSVWLRIVSGFSKLVAEKNGRAYSLVYVGVVPAEHPEMRPRFYLHDELVRITPI